MFDEYLRELPIFLLVAVRCFALVMTLPLFSARTVPRIAKIALCGFMAYIIIPNIDLSVYDNITKNSAATLEYIPFLLGEATIGIITGFSVSVIFAAFSSAGQFFAFQMGFSASEVYDALSQVENPLMGQFFNLIAILMFLQNHWCLQLFTTGLVDSFKALNTYNLIAGREIAYKYLINGLSILFYNAFIISLPIMGSLFLVSVSMGLVSKAAPQMNLISDTFPITLTFSFYLIMVLLPYFCEFFERSFYAGFMRLQELWTALSGGIL